MGVILLFRKIVGRGWLELNYFGTSCKKWGGGGEGIKFWKPYRVEYSMIEVARWVRVFCSPATERGIRNYISDISKNFADTSPVISDRFRNKNVTAVMTGCADLKRA